MLLLEAGFREAIDKDEASHAAKKLRRACDQLEHERRGIAHRAGDVREDHQIDVPRTSRAKTQIGQSAAALDRRADSAPEIEPSRVRHTQASAKPHPKASRDWCKRIARFVEFQIGVLLEWRAFDLFPSRVMPARVGR